MTAGFIDYSGARRVPTCWGFNAYATAYDAERNARATVRRGTSVFIWRLSDGTYDWTGTMQPALPWQPAELIKSFAN